jgi:hypothetical protein
MQNTNQTFNKLTQELLHDKPEAFNFIVSYSMFLEVLDDHIDADKPNTPTIETVVNMHTTIMSSNYWRANADKLYLVDQLIHLIYGVSNIWMTSTDDWKRIDARCLSHCGYFMRLAIILNERGMETARAFAPDFMERLHYRQLTH